MIDGDVPPQRVEPSRTPDAQPSAAYVALAQVGRAEPRMALSAADCAALEELATEWLARGASAGLLVQALTSGLPEPVHAPRALARSRLVSKMPPALPAPEVAARTLMECTDCGVPGSPDALPGGLCRACRLAPAPGGSLPDGRGQLDPADVRHRAARLRDALPGTVRRARGVASPDTTHARSGPYECAAG
ncbi:hypothetical protein U9R90_13150 [Streptomyces sp. E11-3]|uniref:hypothetical protein n=1 Tax=Streptomyces sp. E11-3 TaxID=3110112 RepID=UPI00397EA9ED